jgi:hypothetical protein
MAIVTPEVVQKHNRKRKTNKPKQSISQSGKSTESHATIVMFLVSFAQGMCVVWFQVQNILRRLSRCTVSGPVSVLLA